MELVTVENGIITVAEEVLKQLHEFQVKLAEMQLLEKQIKEDLLNAMESNGIKSWDNDYFKVTYKAPSTRKAIDSNKLKEQGLYDMFVKESPVKSSVVMTWK